MSDLRTAIEAALNELGVPNEDYAAPVANAVTILHAALAATPPALDVDALAEIICTAVGRMGGIHSMPRPVGPCGMHDEHLIVADAIAAALSTGDEK